MSEENKEIIIDNAKVMTKEEAKQLETIKVNGNKGKPKSEAWKIAHKEAMKVAWARKKANTLETPNP